MKLKFYSISILICILSISLQSYAQKSVGTIKGFVYDSKSAEPLPYANVQLVGSSQVAVTDINGFFNLPNVNVGSYKLLIKFIGYNMDSSIVSVEENKTSNLKLFLKESETTLNEIKIDVKKQERKTQTQVSTISFNAKTINKIPTIGGEPELAQFLQIIPGVVFTGDHPWNNL